MLCYSDVFIEQMMMGSPVGRIIFPELRGGVISCTRMDTPKRTGEANGSCTVLKQIVLPVL